MFAGCARAATSRVEVPVREGPVEVMKVEEAREVPEVEAPVVAPVIAGDIAPGVAADMKLAGPVLLGARRAAIEAEIGGAKGRRGVWAEYAEVELRYAGDRCVGLRRTVPAGLGCDEAARWIGYPDAGAPLRRADRCEWPGVSLRHRLADGVAGSLVLAGGVFELWLL